MRLQELIGYARTEGLLHRLSGGHGGRAALVLIGCHLVPAVVCAVLWGVGITPAFDQLYWIPAVVATLVALVGTVWLMMAFGFWGVGLASGHDGGDQYADDFAPRVAFALGWLRLFIQIVMIGVCFVACASLWVGVRWWHLASTPEIEAVPAKVATIPVPEDWTRTGTVNREPPWADYNGSYTSSFDLPQGYTFSDLEEWFHASEWQSSFGRLSQIECDSDLERCEAEVVAREGEQMSYSLEAWYHVSSIEGLPPSLRITLQYVVPQPGE